MLLVNFYTIYLYLIIATGIFGQFFSYNFELNIQLAIRLFLSFTLLFFTPFFNKVKLSFYFYFTVIHVVVLYYFSHNISTILQLYDFLLLGLVFHVIKFRFEVSKIYPFFIFIIYLFIVEIFASILIGTTYSFDSNGRFHSFFISSTKTVFLTILFFSYISFTLYKNKFWFYFMPLSIFILMIVQERAYILSYIIFVGLILIPSIKKQLNPVNFFSIIVSFIILVSFIAFAFFDMHSFFKSGYFDSLLVRYIAWLKAYFLIDELPPFSVLRDYTRDLPNVQLSFESLQLPIDFFTEDQLLLINHYIAPLKVDKYSAHNFFLEAILNYGIFGYIYIYISLYYIFKQNRTKFDYARFSMSLVILVPMFLLSWHNHYYWFFLFRLLDYFSLPCRRVYS